MKRAVSPRCWPSWRTMSVTCYPKATEQKHIDLDNGVKKNYVEFGLIR